MSCKVSCTLSIFVFIKGECSSELISLNCQSISPVAAQILNMWKDSSLICYKRAESMNFYKSVDTQAPQGGISATMDTCSSN